MSYYRIDSSDENSQIFINSLILAANRGVIINILLDFKFAGLDNDFIALLSNTKNISLHYYNPISLKRIKSLQVSLHTKFLIVDNNWIISGGRNISDAFLCEANKDKIISYDLDVLINANKNEDIIKEYNQLFNRLLSSDFTSLISKKASKQSLKIKAEIENIYNYYYSKNSHLINNYPNDTLKQLYYVDSINLISSSINPENKEPLIATIMYNIANSNKSKITILSPYVIGDKLIIEKLNKINQTNEITLLTNSLKSSPNYPAFSNYLLHRNKFIKTNINIYEYQSKENISIHTKAYKLNDNVWAVGSHNLDNRSLFINIEHMLIIKSDKFNEEMDYIVNKKIED